MALKLAILKSQWLLLRQPAKYCSGSKTKTLLKMESSSTPYNRSLGIPWCLSISLQVQLHLIWTEIVWGVHEHPMAVLYYNKIHVKNSFKLYIRTRH